MQFIKPEFVDYISVYPKMELDKVLQVGQMGYELVMKQREAQEKMKDIYNAQEAELNQDKGKLKELNTQLETDLEPFSKLDSDLINPTNRQRLEDVISKYRKNNDFIDIASRTKQIKEQKEIYKKLKAEGKTDAANFYGFNKSIADSNAEYENTKEYNPNVKIDYDFVTYSDYTESWKDAQKNAKDRSIATFEHFEDGKYIGVKTIEAFSPAMAEKISNPLATEEERAMAIAENNALITNYYMSHTTNQDWRQLEAERIMYAPEKTLSEFFGEKIKGFVEYSSGYNIKLDNITMSFEAQAGLKKSPADKEEKKDTNGLSIQASTPTQYAVRPIIDPISAMSLGEVYKFKEQIDAQEKELSDPLRALVGNIGSSNDPGQDMQNMPEIMKFMKDPNKIEMEFDDKGVITKVEDDNYRITFDPQTKTFNGEIINANVEQTSLEKSNFETLMFKLDSKSLAYISDKNKYAAYEELYTKLNMVDPNMPKWVNSKLEEKARSTKTHGITSDDLAYVRNMDNDPNKISKEEEKFVKDNFYYTIESGLSTRRSTPEETFAVYSGTKKKDMMNLDDPSPFDFKTSNASIILRNLSKTTVDKTIAEYLKLHPESQAAYNDYQRGIAALTTPPNINAYSYIIGDGTAEGEKMRLVMQRHLTNAVTNGTKIKYVATDEEITNKDVLTKIRDAFVKGQYSTNPNTEGAENIKIGDVDNISLRYDIGDRSWMIDAYVSDIEAQIEVAISDPEQHILQKIGLEKVPVTVLKSNLISAARENRNLETNTPVKAIVRRGANAAEPNFFLTFEGFPNILVNTGTIERTANLMHLYEVSSKTIFSNAANSVEDRLVAAERMLLFMGVEGNKAKEAAKKIITSSILESNNDDSTNAQSSALGTNYGGIAAKTNNPGNMTGKFRSNAGYLGNRNDNQIAIFDSPESGWRATVDRHIDFLDNGTNNYPSNMTMRKFLATYAEKTNPKSKHFSQEVLNNTVDKHIELIGNLVGKQNGVTFARKFTRSEFLDLSLAEFAKILNHQYPDKNGEQWRNAAEHWASVRAWLEDGKNAEFIYNNVKKGNLNFNFYDFR